MNENSHESDHSLVAECRIFSAYLINKEPDEYICAKYCEAHRVHGVVKQNWSDSFDRFIIRLAQRRPAFTRMADVYTRWFYRRSALRRKLLLLMAIIECTGSSFSVFEADRDLNKARVYLLLISRGITFVLYLAASLVFFSAAYPVVKSASKMGWSIEVNKQWERS